MLICNSKKAGKPAGINWYGLKVSQPCVYMLTNRRNGTLYVGVTSDLKKRMEDHKNNEVPGLGKSFGAHTLVWFEKHPTLEAAMNKEKAMKGWKRRWQVDLIQRKNPAWKDLSPF